MPINHMRYIWSPWRMEYIEGNTQESGCLFCRILSTSDGAENLVIHRGERAFVVLNRFPYTNGHMMVVPMAHQATLEGLPETTLTEIMLLINRAIGALRDTYDAENFNVGINIGEAAGAGVVGHVHVHVLARWSGDTSFMSTTSDTRVIPESLETTYSRLREAWERGSQRPPGSGASASQGADAHDR
jgi:ATP adenylyltransferase